MKPEPLPEEAGDFSIAELLPYTVPPHELGGPLLDSTGSILRAMEAHLHGSIGLPIPELAQKALETGVRSAATLPELHAALGALTLDYEAQGIRGPVLTLRKEGPATFAADLASMIERLRGEP